MSAAVSSTHIPCREAVARFGDLLDGDLERGAYLDVQQHLRHCAPCAAYLESCRATEHLLRWAFDAGDA